MGYDGGVFAARAWLWPLIFAVGVAAWYCARSPRAPHAPDTPASHAGRQPLLIEHLAKEVAVDRLRLSWTTTLPVRSTLVYAAHGAAPAKLEVAETAGTSHAAELAGLSPDSDYEITIESRGAAGEEYASSAFSVKLFATLARDAVQEVERAAIPQRIRDAVWELDKNKRKPDRERLRAMLREKFDPVRPALKLVRSISHEFFSSPEVWVSSKIQMYAALKLVEHLDRLVAVRGLPMVELLGPLDWGTYGELTTSFGDPALPLPAPRGPSVPGIPPPAYLIDPKLMPGIHVDQQLVSPTGPKALTEWRDQASELAAIEVFGRGEKDGVQEQVYRFALVDPATVSAAELWLMFNAVSPYQFFELEVNGRAALVLRPPAAKGGAWAWYHGGVGVDPALLVTGENVVKLRLKPLPTITEGHRAFVWFMELRTRQRP